MSEGELNKLELEFKKTPPHNLGKRLELSRRIVELNKEEHIVKEGSRLHVLHYDTQGVHCSEPNCEINHRNKEKGEGKW